jgi:large subunit ribosomal protein L32e
MKKRKFRFNRQEGYRLVKLKKKWRRPRGRHSKLRMHEKARGRYPGPGYGSPRLTRGLTRSGLREVRISNPKEVEGIDPEKDLIVIAGSVGKKKALDIVKAAEAREIKVRNKPKATLKKPKSKEKEESEKKPEPKQKQKK